MEVINFFLIINNLNFNFTFEVIGTAFNGEASKRIQMKIKIDMKSNIATFTRNDINQSNQFDFNQLSPESGMRLAVSCTDKGDYLEVL